MEQLMIFEDMAPEKRDAAMLHLEIQQALVRVVDSVADVGRMLKQMRDTKGWMALGFDSFTAYTENALGVKQRQAYIYIEVAEKVHPKIAEAYAAAGVTKLSLLAKLSWEQQKELTNEISGDMTAISTKELAELVREKQGLSEQLSLLREERTQAVKTAREAAETAHNLAIAEAKEEIEGRIAEAVAQERDKANKILKNAMAEAADNLQKARDEAASARAELEQEKKKAEKKIADANAAAIAFAKARSEAQQDYDKAIAEEKKRLTEESERRAAELAEEARQKALAEVARMQLTRSEEAIRVAVAMGDMQNRLNDALEALDALRGRDADGADALAGKVARMLDKLRDAWRQEAGVDDADIQ